MGFATCWFSPSWKEVDVPWSYADVLKLTKISRTNLRLFLVPAN